MGTPTRARENPFRSEKVAAFRYRGADNSLAEWSAELARRSVYHLAIVGPMGTGKTVLLEDLRDRMGGGEWLQLHREDSLRRKLGLALRLYGDRPVPLFADGLESLPPVFLRLKRLFRPRIVATLHQPGKSFDTLIRTRFEPGVARRLVEFLTGRPLTAEQASAIEDTEVSSGNMRELIRTLYWNQAGKVRE